MKQSKYKFTSSQSTAKVFPFNFQKISNLTEKLETKQTKFYIFLRKLQRKTGFDLGKTESISLLSHFGFVFVHKIVQRFPIMMHGMANQPVSVEGEWLLIEGRVNFSDISSLIENNAKNDIYVYELNKIDFLNITRTSSNQNQISDYRYVISSEENLHQVSFSIKCYKDYFNILEIAQNHSIKLKYSRINPTSPLTSFKGPKSPPIPNQVDNISTDESKKSNDHDASDSLNLISPENFVVNSKSFINFGRELIFEQVDLYFYFRILTDGVEFFKYSTNFLMSTKRRKVFFTHDLEYMCWSKPKKLAIKKQFKVSDIEGITYGRATKNFARFATYDNASMKRSFSILLTHRSIDLEAYYLEDVRNFSRAVIMLPEIIRLFKGNPENQYP